MNTLDVVAQVLREAGPRSLTVREIVQLAESRLPTTSRTPATVVSRDLAVDIRDRGEESLFARVDRGKFVLRAALPSVLAMLHAELRWEPEISGDGYCACFVRDEISVERQLGLLSHSSAGGGR